MKKHPIAAVVNFCSNERRFIKSCLEQVQIFARETIVMVCDHFFDGTPENRQVLEKIYTAFPECRFVEYPFIPDKIPKSIWKQVDPAHFWHSFSRLLGASLLDETIDTVLFLDADEVPEGNRFAEWLDCSDYHQNTVLKFANYWYFREPTNQALQFEDSVVMVRKQTLEPDILLRQEERDAIYDLLPFPKRRKVTGTNGEPMFHHYSWVRTQEEMLKKVKAWGHKKDRNWVELVNKEFSAPFSGKDFVHGYNYKTVEAPFDIHLKELDFEPKGKPRVERLTANDLLKLLPRNRLLSFFRP